MQLKLYTPRKMPQNEQESEEAVNKTGGVYTQTVMRSVQAEKWQHLCGWTTDLFDSILVTTGKAQVY